MDGTKIRANNAKGKAYNKKILEEKIARIDAHVAGWPQDLDQQDALETDEPSFFKEEITAILATLKERRDTYQGYLEKIGNSRGAQLLATDPDARVMNTLPQGGDGKQATVSQRRENRIHIEAC